MDRLSRAISEIKDSAEKIARKHGLDIGELPCVDMGYVGLLNISLYSVSSSDLQTQWLYELDEIKRLGVSSPTRIYCNIDDSVYELIGIDPDYGSMPIKLFSKETGEFRYASISELHIYAEPLDQ